MPTPTIIVHGGAGTIPAALADAYLQGVRAAAELGLSLLRSGSSALDAVEAAVRHMEDSATFDAGSGSVLTQTGHVEQDAAIMDGHTLRLGAVAAVRHVRNPVTLARRVMEGGRFALLVGEGAEQFAVENGVGLVDEEELISRRERELWEKWTEGMEAEGGKRAGDTVGAVALDGEGRIAAATSTGGLRFKYPGRVGDSPLPGCGFYATRVGGASSTGYGEAIMRVVLAKTAVDGLNEPFGLEPHAAARRAIAGLAAIESTGGVILLDALGRPGWAFNSPHMAYAWVGEDGEVKVAI